MRNLFRILKALDWPQTCLNCSTADTEGARICQKCFDLLVRQYQNPERLLIKGHRVETLLRWVPNASNTLSALHLELKKSQSCLWQKFAMQFIRKKMIQTDFEIQNQSACVFISLISESGGTHAQDWAQSLSEQLGIPHFSALKKCQNNSFALEQKQRSRIQRTGLSLELSVDISTLTGKKIIFVDDIVTTGATLDAAYKALGQPQDFSAWCLSYRSGPWVADKDQEW